MNVTPVPNRDVAGTRVTYAKRRSQAAANIDPTGDRLLPFGRSRGRPFGDMPRAGILWKYGRDRIGPPQNVARVVANATCRFCRKTLAPDIAAAIRCPGQDPQWYEQSVRRSLRRRLPLLLRTHRQMPSQLAEVPASTWPFFHPQHVYIAIQLGPMVYAVDLGWQEASVRRRLAAFVETRSHPA